MDDRKSIVTPILHVVIISVITAALVFLQVFPVLVPYPRDLAESAQTFHKTGFWISLGIFIATAMAWPAIGWLVTRLTGSLRRRTYQIVGVHFPDATRADRLLHAAYWPFDIVWTLLWFAVASYAHRRQRARKQQG
jgi:hypothetical protein